ncbi:MAG: hypothetical protein IJE01_05140 [Clostridia bacterium]|nr:hypothetical protein [Clostridia bacterium]
MKKIIALMITVLVLVASFGTLTAFAADSPEAKPAYKVEVTTYSGGKAETGTYTTLEDGTIKFNRTENSTEKFTGWVIDGKEGVDYIIVSGNLTSDELVIKPLNNIKVEESYDVDGSKGEGQPEVGGSNDSTQSPPTGNNALASIAVLGMLSLAGAVAVKKVKA